MNRFLIPLLFSVMLCVRSPLLAQDVPESEVVHPNQRATVSDLSLVKAHGANPADIAKAALEIVLSAAKIKCDPGSQLETVVEANAEFPLSTLANMISGSGCTMSGRTGRVKSAFIPNGGIRANELITSIIQGKPLLIRWKSTLYVLYGVVYDQHLKDSGNQDNVIRELQLIDPRYLRARRFVTFVRDKDNFEQVEGIASVSVSW